MKTFNESIEVLNQTLDAMKENENTIRNLVFT